MVKNLYLLLVLFCQFSLAQSIVYLDDNKQETSKKRAKYAVTYEQRGNMIYSQKILLIEEGGLVIEEMELKSINPQIKHGTYQKFYKSGQLQTNGKYFENKKFGIWKDYYENGQMECIYTVLNDTSHYMQYWTEEGDPVIAQGNGVVTYYDKNQKSDVTVHFVNSLRHSMYSVSPDLNDTIYSIVETLPEFQGGLEKFYQFIGQKITYPDDARRKGIQGKVYVQLVVNQSGETENVEVLKGINAGCDKEAERAVKRSSGKWTPGQHEGKPVKVRMVLPVYFKLRN